MATNKIVLTDREAHDFPLRQWLEDKWQQIITHIPTKWLPPGSPLTGARRALAYYALNCIEQPKYLEIGCRRGHSLAIVLAAAGDSLRSATTIDLWIEGYGNETQASPDQVLHNLQQLDLLSENVTLLTGDSHDILPKLTGNDYNLVYIDGDHTPEGARQDIEDCIAATNDDSIIVFDDAMDELLVVWRDIMSKYDDFIPSEYLDSYPPFTVL